MREWPQVEVGSARELREWLASASAGDGPVWLVHGRKAARDRYLPYGALVEELLCFGWIDSRPRALDETRTMVLIARRKPGSNWSKDNRERVARLESEGRMRAPGRRAVELARRDGSWDRLRETESGQAPADLAAALKGADAQAGWEELSLATRRRALEFLLAAKRPETRARRIAQIVSASAEGRDPTQWRPKS